MKNVMRRRACFAFLLLLTSIAPLLEASHAQEAGFAYPPTRRIEHVDTYHGVEVADPYVWLEAMETEETQAWLHAQDTLLHRFLDDVPVRHAIEHRLAALRNFDSYGAPTKQGGRTFFSMTEAGKNQPVVYVQEGAEPRVLLDPYTLFKDDETLLAGTVPGPNGKRLLFLTSKGQSRWQRARILDVETGEILPEEMGGYYRGRSGVAWTQDGAGFFYARYKEPAAGQEIEARVENARLYYHRLGTPQAEDELIYERPDVPDWIYFPRVTHDGRTLVLTVIGGEEVGNRIFYKNLESPSSEVVALIDTPDATYSFEGSDGSRLFFRTTLDAPRERMIAIDLERPGREDWTEVIPEGEATMAAASEIGDHLVVQYIQDARFVVKVYDFDGRFRYELDLPDIGYVGGLADNREDGEAFYSFGSLYDPGSLYRLDVPTGQSTLFRRPALPYDPGAFETKQVFYHSKDGTRVPMFIAHEKGLEPDGSQPLFMYAYGAFNWSAFPWYQPNIIAWMELGGIYALPNIRGGGEYGEAWRQAGIRHNKQNGIDDYLAAAEWLVENGYTTSDRLVANGGSASGVLPGTAITQRPDLFGAAVVNIAALDKLRYHLFGSTNSWRADFGAADDPDDFAALHAYSPYHNLKAGTCYPATWIQVGERDETTSPMHGYKFAAALQAAQGCAIPVLLKIAWGAGHSYGATRSQSDETMAQELAFLVAVLGMEVPEAYLSDGSR